MSEKKKVKNAEYEVVVIGGGMKDKPNKIEAKLIVKVEAEFYDDESSEEAVSLGKKIKEKEISVREALDAVFAQIDQP